MRADLSYAALTRNARFVAVDVETTDSDEGVHVISVGVVPWAGGQSRGAFELFATPAAPSRRPGSTASPTTTSPTNHRSPPICRLLSVS